MLKYKVEFEVTIDDEMTHKVYQDKRPEELAMNDWEVVKARVPFVMESELSDSFTLQSEYRGQEVTTQWIENLNITKIEGED